VLLCTPDIDNSLPYLLIYLLT